MLAGGPDDHPLTDILVWKRDIYGGTADACIREIATLCSTRELYVWWERTIGWNGTPALAAEQSRIRLGALRQRAQESGWETRFPDA